MPTDSIDFWKAFHKFVLRDDIVILGGNDNDGSIPVGYVPIENEPVEWIHKITDQDGELRVRHELPQYVTEAVDVGFVQGGIHFVQHAEGAGTTAEDGQQQGYAGERAFAAGQE